MNELLKLPDKLSQQEPLAVQVRVDGLKGVVDSAKNRVKMEKKLCLDGLMVNIGKDKDGLVGVFEIGGKRIKFSKSKDDEKTSLKDQKVEVLALRNDVEADAV